MEARVARLEARDEVRDQMVQKLVAKLDSVNAKLTDLVAADKAKAKMIGWVMALGPTLGVIITKLWG